MNLVDLESKAKFYTWVGMRGMSKTDAMQQYSTEVNLMATKYCVVFPSSQRSRFGSFASLSTCTTSVPESSEQGDEDTVSINSDVSLL